MQPHRYRFFEWQRPKTATIESKKRHETEALICSTRRIDDSHSFSIRNEKARKKNCLHFEIPDVMALNLVKALRLIYCPVCLLELGYKLIANAREMAGMADRTVRNEGENRQMEYIARRIVDRNAIKSTQSGTFCFFIIY